MAVVPLYAENLESLLTTVRIEPADDANTLAAVNQAVTDVRLGFFRKIGKTRALEIAGFPLVDNPESDSEILRSQGESAEALWLTVLLVQRLPVLFMDNTAVNDVFNDEPLTRDSNSKMREYLKDIKGQLDDLLGEMAEPETVTDSTNKASLNGPSEPCLIRDTFIGKCW